MRGACFNRLMAGAAMVVVLAVTDPNSGALAQPNVNLEAGVPVPDTSPLAPPTAADISPVPQAAETATPVQAAVGERQKEATATPAEATGTVGPATAAAGTLGTDAAIAEKLRELSAGKFDRILGGKKERVEVENFYAARNFAPLWVSETGLTERARAVAGYLAGVDADGMDPSDYGTPTVAAGAEPDAQAEAEIKFTQTLLTFARHAQTGRVHYSRVASDVEYDLDRPEAADVLTRVSTAANVKAALDTFHPPHAGYKALKQKLAEIRGGKAETPAIRISGGPVLKLAKKPMHDPRVPQLRQRLGVTGSAADSAYDKPLADAVAKFQRENGLKATGQLTSATLDALNGVRRDNSRHADLIIANMERWRWIPRDLGNIHVMVNVPDYTLRVMKDGKQVWSTKIVVGKPTQATPIMSAEMKYITVNPTWNVPPSIIQKEYLPALREDPDALNRIGLKVAYNSNGSIRIYQPPGERNALGRIRFNFPNKFLVYQHDTPDKHLFAHDRRAYSHGCMRVQDPAKYGEVLLSLVRPNEGYTQDRLQKMFGRGEVNIQFPQSIPVHLTYQTAFVEGGKLVTREDIYSRDTRVLAALKGDQRRVADAPVERRKSAATKPARVRANSTYAGAPRYYRSSSFFDQMFGTRWAVR